MINESSNVKFQTSILRDMYKTHTTNCAKLRDEKTVERNATHLYSAFGKSLCA